MDLTIRQRGALIGLINSGFAHTAASLSDLTGHRVLFSAPKIALHPIHELSNVLSHFVKGEVAIVHQIFAGPIAGDALLLFGYEGALALTNLLANKPVVAPRLDASTREVLIEAGNILLNACLEMFSNVLHAQISFSVPRLHLEPLDVVLRSLVNGREEPRHAVVAKTAFRLRDSEVTSHLIIVPGLASFNHLIKQIEHWKARQ